MGTERKPAVLLLDSVLRGEPEKNVLVPMALAYLVSAHVEVVFPVPAEILPEIDALYDELLSRLPISRQGVTYKKLSDRESLKNLVSETSLLLTDYPHPSRLGLSSGAPSVIFKPSDLGLQVQLRNTSRLQPDSLRQQLTVWAELLNVSVECRQ